ncbi:Restriction endonuclease BglII [Nitrosospira multiformis]|uniref:Restriction endonuclease BglII n=1 Tax=Nitrosospira multiformis TaxID=1231 RepID=A0A1H9YF43_9PROT|nr:BglII/BstYI family type II restriction endonuclease [Nitrosospira multiformis]SES67173.1 Restriction endonuclease BglII [Nitrosospira multiformis]
MALDERTQPITTKPSHDLTGRGFEVLYVSHAAAILAGDFPDASAEINQILLEMDLPITEVIGSGGGETKFTQRLRHALAGLGWRKHNFILEKTIDGVPREATSHEVDHVKRYPAGVIACEIEWNNKDPFFDRDLENFKRLHVEGAISVGVLITRGSSLQERMSEMVTRFATERNIVDFDSLAAAGVIPTPRQRANIEKRVNRTRDPIPFANAWVDNFVSNKYGAATTHWAKLIHRVERGVGNPCPLLLIGLPASIVQFDAARVDEISEADLSDDSGHTETS